jgi:hypothetical protein
MMTEKKSNEKSILREKRQREFYNDTKKGNEKSIMTDKVKL